MFDPTSTRASSLPGKWLDAATAAKFEREATDAYRVHSSGGGWVERLGGDLLLSYKDDATLARLLEEGHAWRGSTGLPLQRFFAKLLPKQNADRVTPTLAWGEAALPLETQVQEAGTRYGLDFGAGYSAGLFLDQRANRAFVRRLRPQRLLNTFAYTCSFSVVAAQVGGVTTSVDLSKKSLDRGRANFELNGLSTEGHKFIADSVLEVLPRLARRGEKYDAIILDPPTFSRSHDGKRFQVEHDFEGLLASALEVAAPRASLLLSTNCTRLDRRALERIARHCLKLTRQTGTFHTEPPLVDIPPTMAATTLWLTLR
jgi:23S rRNA (cytosine1962-C5)-methyltransferase